MNNAALNPPTSAGTAPFNEISAQHQRDAGQRDDREATEAAENLLEEQRQTKIQLPPGFRWMHVTVNGKRELRIKPTMESVRDLTELTAEFFGAREFREEEVETDTKLNKILDSLVANLGRSNQFLGGSSLAYNLAPQYAQQLAGAIRWVDIHARNVERYQNNGNEDAAESSLYNLEASRNQALKIASVLDWCEDSGATVNITRGVDQCLNLAAWSLQNNQSSGPHRRAAQNTTREMLWGGRTPQPDEVAEREEEESATI